MMLARRGARRNFVPQSCFESPVGAKRGYPGKGRLAQLGARRRTVKTIEKITGTMQMVAQAQLTRDMAQAQKTREAYFNLNALYDWVPKQQPKKILTIVVTSNRGLCGPLNNQLIRDLCARPDFNMMDVFVVGDKGAQALEKRTGDNERVFASAHPVGLMSYNDIAFVTDKLAAKYEEYDEVKIVFNKLISQNNYETAEISIPSPKTLIDNIRDNTFDMDENYKDLFKTYHEFHLANALNYTYFQNCAAETLSRRNAMDAATKNCKELTKKLNIEFNKLRQAIITTELIEVTTGAVAVEEMSS